MNTTFQRTAASDEWFTPKEIIEALGVFDLDPCAAHGWLTASSHLYKEDDGLAHKWWGRVWLNPPYSRRLISPFIHKMAEHGDGIALIFNRMDITLWHDVIFPTATAMLVMRDRLKFYRPDGTQGESAGCGSVLVAWGEYNAEALINSNIHGKFFRINPDNTKIQPHQS
ncbi:MAG: phage N-6-adenine-methyltransferase [Muribaculaceae bacterium]|nr:phage N-6-adenine-methyltransferase [Muribaculaceae bacterium]